MRIHASGGEPSLTEVDDLGRLSLALVAEQEDAVSAWGRWIDDDHVAVAQDLLLSLAGPLALDPTWRAEFDSMVAYAASKGWVDDRGDIHVHVEQVAPDGEGGYLRT